MMYDVSTLVLMCVSFVCQHRTRLCDSVLNDTCVSMGSEEFSAQTTKNEHEENLYQCDQERFEVCVCVLYGVICMYVSCDLSHSHVRYVCYHTSYIIHHTSYITHHTPYIIHHTSYIIHHTSIHHTSYITHTYIIHHHTPHIIHHTSHITHHTSYLIHHIQLDMKIEIGTATIRILEPLLEKIWSMSPEQSAKFKLSDELEPLHLRSIGRLYGKHGSEIIEELKNNPVASVCVYSIVIHHTSYIIHHISHITSHTSHITHHTSHITHHTSHITHHTSHITPHTSHITHHTSHITHHTSHITHHTSHNCDICCISNYCFRIFLRCFVGEME